MDVAAAPPLAAATANAANTLASFTDAAVPFDEAGAATAGGRAL